MKFSWKYPFRWFFFSVGKFISRLFGGWDKDPRFKEATKNERPDN